MIDVSKILEYRRKRFCARHYELKVKQKKIVKSKIKKRTDYRCYWKSVYYDVTILYILYFYLCLNDNKKTDENHYSNHR